MIRYVTCVCLFLSFNIHAQERCGVNEAYFEKHGESEDIFESWIAQQRLSRAPQANQRQEQAQQVLTIPVVFHIIHNGEEIGEGRNLSEARILDQLRILNEDYRRRNADRDLTPAEFLDVAADTEIEFVLAKQDPNGLPTDGIVRKRGSKATYEFEDPTLFEESFWPPEDYMNMIVCDIITPYIGWAAFPFTNIDGIGDRAETNRLRDGVVMDFRYIGVNPETGSSFESFGRTTTHEVGHFLGLKHVWGTGSSCSSDDFCEDTPAQSEDYLFECPDSPVSTCGSNDMYSNYLNYTDDACMNIFTLCQKERMRIVLENSPRRASLLTSHALEDPVMVANDLGIASILSPLEGNCSNLITPTVEVRNFGTNPIQSFSVALQVNQQMVDTIFRSVTLESTDVHLINFPSTTIASNEITQVSFHILTVNSGEDGNSSNDMQLVEVPDGESVPLPYRLDFESASFTIAKTESELLSAWETDNVPYFTEENMAAVMDFRNHSASFGLFDYLITPIIDLSAVNSVDLRFAFAYQPSLNSYEQDGLIVAVSTDCGQTFPAENYVFEEYGGNLGTVPASDSPFVPTGPVDWRQVEINLTRFAGNSDIRIAFIGHHGNSSSLYLDDIEVIPTDLAALDLGVRSVSNLPLVTCRDAIFPSIEIRNYGYETVDSFDLGFFVNGIGDLTNQTNQNLAPGFGSFYEASALDLETGEYDVLIHTTNPNALPDENTSNDTIIHHLIIDDSEEILPIRTTFDPPDDWISTNAANTSIWRRTDVNGNIAMMAGGFGSNQIGMQSWLISPVLHADQMDTVSMIFDYAYGKRTGFSDRLTVLLSVSCGQEYQYVLFDASSAQLEGEESQSSYSPTTEEEWHQVFIDLNEYKVWNSFRIAFVFTNGTGNNLFIDDIEFINTTNPSIPRFEPEITSYPNPANQILNLSFNLPEKEDVTVSLMDVSGRVYILNTYRDILNHIIRLDLPSSLSGMYLLRTTGVSFTRSEKILIQK